MARVSVEQRRRDLVDAAFRVIARDGIGQSTTRAICAEAGVHQSVFHYSFRSKKELFQELVRTTVVAMVDAALLVSEVSHDPGKSIRDGMRRVWAEAQAHPERQLVGYELTTYVLRDPELAELASWQYEQYYAQSERFVSAIESAAGVRWSVPRAVLVRMFTTAIDGLVLSWLAAGDTEGATAAIDAFADYFSSLAVTSAR
ncbi:TetR/AcrR family transcriptional regulator [Amycolatopsis pithecellobii]|uniref:TetR family transcriptional regulator n=1 Tax=Amycolatopsis pithecellobii TaxID=664692 RepID=A0A6N7Z2N0_9PSEU|nr:TetR/AcrR family transcriptional regulator [Amycolatopsis pithecellobii]MTD54311.1 TetR family transcriptional regulator [Amycolatopsis pithecellobii]